MGNARRVAWRRLPGIQVHEEAQDPISVGRAVSARVDVDQLVAGVSGEAAALLFHGAKAGGPHRPAPREFRHPALEEVAHALGVGAQDAKRPIDDGARRLEAGQPLRPGVVADVLAAEMAQKARAEKLLIFVGWQRQRTPGEMDDAAPFQRVRPVAPVGFVQHEGRGP
jgi:hypothetical protein